MNKTKKIVAGVAAVAAVACCGAALAGCGGGSSSAKTYSMRIDSWSEYIEDNVQPFNNVGSGAGTIFNFATWIDTGNKVNHDEDGNMLGVYWQFNLEVEESSMEGYYDYTFEWVFHADPSDAYKVAMDSVYTAQGYAVAIDGGYHLYPAFFASYFLIGEAPSETSGFGVDNYVTNIYDGDYDPVYFYIDSNLEAAGVIDGFLAENVLGAFNECDVLVSGSSITGFENVTDNYFKWTHEPGSVVSPNPDTPDEGNTEQPGDEVEGDEDIEYSFEPGWATDSAKVDSLETEVTIENAWAWNTFSMGGKEMGWNSNTVTFAFHDNGTVDVTIAGGGNPNTYTGTYDVYEMMTNKNYVIQLNTIPGGANPDGSTSPDTVWSTGEDANEGGAQIGMNIFRWISKGGKIVISHVMSGEGYQFNVAMGGGDLGGGDFGGELPPLQ